MNHRHEQYNWKVTLSGLYRVYICTHSHYDIKYYLEVGNVRFTVCIVLVY